MIKISSVEWSNFEVVTTSDGTEYRRYSSDAWERLYGSSWEPCYSEEAALEEAYRNFTSKRINAQMVMELREEMGTGLMECKKALFSANGDKEKAKEYIRKGTFSGTILR